MAQAVINNKDSHIHYMGRVDIKDTASVIAWPGTSLSINFTGGEVSVLLSDERGDNYFDIIVDGKVTRNLHLDAGKKEYLLASGLGAGRHTLTLFKPTEWENGKTWFYHFTLDKGARILAAAPVRRHKIEFFGDSITSGYAVEDSTGQDRGSSPYKDNYVSYAAITARHFDAEYYCTSKSGIGILVSWFPLVMSEMYDRLDATDPGSKWDFSRYTPEILVVNYTKDIRMVNKKHGFLLFVFLVVGAAAIGQPVKIHGRLKVEGTQLLDEHNQPYALRGMSLGWSCFWPRFYTAGVVDWLHKDWNCSVVRAAMGVEPQGGYKDNPTGSRALVESVVDGAIKSGIYVIIDWHSHHINLEEAKTFFGEMSAKYAGYPNIIYEIFNEPAEADWPQVKAYAEAVIKVIREKDTSNIILVGCPKWDQEIQLPAADPIKGYKNLMYTMHFYAGTHKQWLRDRTDAAIRAGLPVFISESAGMEASGDGPIDYAEWQRYVDWINKNNLSWVTWSVSDKAETCSVLRPSAGSDGNWKLSDLKESGIKIRAYLRGYHFE